MSLIVQGLIIGHLCSIAVDGNTIAKPMSPMLRARLESTERLARRHRRQGGMGMGGGTQACNSPPCVVSHLGDVALTTVTGKITDGGELLVSEFSIGENIYGPFEAGFTSNQDRVLSGLGCSDPSKGYLPGGLDTRTAQDVVERNCSVKLPRVENGRWIGLIDSCGGHTRDYHFHEEMGCLWKDKYDTNGNSHHSIQVGKVVNNDQYLYGKYENEKTSTLPLLDACGGHFGVTPDSNGQEVYHYHIQDSPPFSIGCIGPSASGGMVSVEECRQTDAECGDGDNVVLTTERMGTHLYDLWCPCYDGNGSNVGTEKLPYQLVGSSTSKPNSSPEVSSSTSSSPKTQSTSSSAAATTAPDSSSTTNPSTGSPSTKPNIVLYMPDDMLFYWPEQPAVPNAQPKSTQLLPNIDRIRNEGAVFQSSYVAGPKCAPARFNILTGRYCSRSIYARSHRTTTSQSNTTRTNVEVPQCKLSGDDRAKTIQTVLQNNGYATIVAGKWHLNGDVTSTQEWNDYDGVVSKVTATGFGTAASVYATNMDRTLNLPFSHNLEWLAATSNAAMETAVTAKKPFFLYFAPTTPHGPNNRNALLNYNTSTTPEGQLPEPPDSAAAFSMTRSDIVRAGSDPTEMGLIWSDQALGSLIKKMETLKVLDNTLIIVTQDHGQSAKDTLMEGGTRVMFAARLPGVITAGTVVTTTTTNLDFAPSILHGIGVTPPYEMDGTSWWPSLTNKSAPVDTRVCLVAEIETDRAIICPSLGIKYINKISSVTGAAFDAYPSALQTHQLYNLTADPTEQVNLHGNPLYKSLEDALIAFLVCHDKDTAATNPVPCNSGAIMESFLGLDSSSTAPVTNSPVSSPPSTTSPVPAVSPTTASPSTMPPISGPPATFSPIAASPVTGSPSVTSPVTNSPTRAVLASSPPTTVPTQRGCPNAITRPRIDVVFPGDFNALTREDVDTCKQTTRATLLSRAQNQRNVVISQMFACSGSIQISAEFEDNTDVTVIQMLSNSIQQSPISINLSSGNKVESLSATVSVPLASVPPTTASSATNAPTGAPTFEGEIGSSTSNADSQVMTGVSVAIGVLGLLLIVLIIAIIVKRQMRKKENGFEKGQREQNSKTYQNPVMEVSGFSTAIDYRESKSDDTDLV